MKKRFRRSDEIHECGSQTKEKLEEAVQSVVPVQCLVCTTHKRPYFALSSPETDGRVDETASSKSARPTATAFVAAAAAATGAGAGGGDRHRRRRRSLLL